MRIINEEGVVFGLLSREERNRINAIRSNDHTRVYRWEEKRGWVTCEDTCSCVLSNVYKAEIPETKIEPLTQEEFLKLGVQYVCNDGADAFGIRVVFSDYVKLSDICDTRFGFDKLAEDNMLGINYKGKIVKLYKEVSE